MILPSTFENRLNDPITDLFASARAIILFMGSAAGKPTWDFRYPRVYVGQ